MKIKFPSHGNPLYPVRFPVLLALGLAIGCPLAGWAATLSWSGGSPTTSNWSDIQNWGFAGTPANGDTLIFPGSQPRLANINDLAGLTVSEIRFVGASGGYAISGNALTVTNGITATNTAGVNAIANNITLASVGLINVGSGASLTLSGAVSGGVSVTKSGLGTLTYTGAANSYSGGTLALEGTLELGKAGDSAIPNTLQVGDPTHAATVRWLSGNQIPNSSTVTLYSGSVLDLNNQIDDLGTLIMYAATVNMGTGFLDFRPPNTITVLSATANINGRIGLPSGDVTVDVQSANNLALNVNASIGSSGGIIKTGPGGLSLNSSNGYGGLTVVQDGWLWIKNASGLGSSSSGTVVSNGASLVLQGAFGVTNEALTLNGFGESSSWGALDTESSFTNFWTGPITLNATSTIAPWSSSSVLRISGAISGPGGFTLGSQTGGGSGICYLEGTAANTYAGTTIVGGGTLLLGRTGGNGLAIPGNLIIGNSRTVRCLSDFQVYSSGKAVTVNTGGLFDLANFSEWIGPLTLNGGQVTSGTGIFYLSGDITVVRNTTAQSLITGNAQLWNGTYTITNTGHFFSPDLRFSANLSANSTYGVIKTGDGEVSLAGTNNTFGGPVTINQGLLWIEHDTGLGNTNTAATVNNGGSLYLSGNVAVGNKPLVLNGPGAAFGALVAGNGNSSWVGPVTLASDAVLDVYSGASLNLSGAIEGGGALTKVDAGTLRFSGGDANTYTGTTTVAAGTLELNKTAGVTAVPGPLIIGDGVGGANADVVRLLNFFQISDVSDVQINSSGLFDLGTTYDVIDELSGNGNLTFGVSGFLTVGANNGSSTFDGIASGPGYAGGYTLRKTGTGVFTLNGNNTFQNQTRVDNGVIIINGSQPQSPLFVFSTLATAGGRGVVGDIRCFGSLAPGNSPATLTSSNLFFSSGGYFVELTGPTPGTDYDQLVVHGTNNLGGAALTVYPAFTKPVAVGQKFTIIDNDGTDPIVGTFNGLDEGAAITSGFYTFTISYAGGSGNDVVLTLTNLPAATLGGLTTVTTGNGNGAIDPNECNLISVVLTNTTAAPMTGISARLASVSGGVIVADQVSAYPNAGAFGTSTNTIPFQISTTTNFVCGSDINLQLTVTSASHGAFTVPVVLRSGSPAAVPARFDNNVVTNVPDIGTIESTNTVAAWSGPISRIAVSLWLVAPFSSDVNLTLIAPNGASVDLSSGNGAGANFGSGNADAARTTFDDSAATSIIVGASPFVGSFRPEGSLASLLAANPVGNWRLRINDGFGAGSPDTLRAWSLFLYPTECAAGSGLCELCPNVVLTSAIGPASPITSGYVNPVGVPSVCGVPKACPGTAGGGYPSETFPFRNGPSNSCITVALENPNPGFGMVVAAYAEGFNPANPDKCANYLADAGAVAGPSYGSTTRSFSFDVAANAAFVVQLVSGGIGPYQLTVSGGDCRPVLNITPSGGSQAVLDWTTAAPGYQLESTNSLSGTGPVWSGISNVPTVVNGRYQVTSPVTGTNQFFRLRKSVP